MTTLNLIKKNPEMAAALAIMLAGFIGAFICAKMGI